jgi:hypothetical protein
MKLRTIKNLLAMVLWYILFSLLFFSCQRSSSFQFLNPAYESMNQFGKTLLVLSLNNELISKSQQQQLLGKKKIKPLLVSRQELAYFYNYMAPTLSEVAVVNVIGIDTSFKANEINFIFNEFKTVEGNNLQIFTPSSGKLSYKNILPDYVLLFEDLYFLKDYIEERGAGLGRGTSSKYTLDTGVEYLLWDNYKEKIVGYGILTKSLNLFDYPSRDVYLSIFEEFANSIIKMSPIAWKQIR